MPAMRTKNRKPATSAPTDGKSATSTPTDESIAKGYYDAHLEADYKPLPKPGLLSLFRHLNSECFRCLRMKPPRDIPLDSAFDQKLLLRMSVVERDDGPFLPEYAEVEAQVNSAFNDVFRYWPILPRSYFDDIFLMLYRTKPFDQNKVQWENLALVYSVLALGQLAYNETSAVMTQSNCSDIRGSSSRRWFQKSVTLTPPSQCHRGEISIRTTMCNALFLLLSGGIMQSNQLIDHVCAALLTANDQSTSHDASVYMACQLLDAYLALLLGQQRRLRNPVLDARRAQGSKDTKTSYDEAISVLRTQLQLVTFVTDYREMKQLSHDRSDLTSDPAMMDYDDVEAALETWWSNAVHEQDHSQHDSKDNAANGILTPIYTAVNIGLQLTYARTKMIAYYSCLSCLLDPANAPKTEYRAALKSVEAAVAVIRAASWMAEHGALPVCIAQTLALASTALLVFEVAQSSHEILCDIRDSRQYGALQAYMFLKALAPAHEGAREYTEVMAEILNKLSNPKPVSSTYGAQ